MTHPIISRAYPYIYATAVEHCTLVPDECVHIARVRGKRERKRKSAESAWGCPLHAPPHVKMIEGVERRELNA